MKWDYRENVFATFSIGNSMEKSIFDECYLNISHHKLWFKFGMGSENIRWVSLFGIWKLTFTTWPHAVHWICWKHEKHDENGEQFRSSRPIELKWRRN